MCLKKETLCVLIKKKKPNHCMEPALKKKRGGEGKKGFLP